MVGKLLSQGASNSNRMSYTSMFTSALQSVVVGLALVTAPVIFGQSPTSETCDNRTGLDLRVALQGSQVLQFASQLCVECRNRCVEARENCKKRACEAAGGRNAPGACVEPTDRKKFTDGLEACSKQEGSCKDQCAAGPCK